MYAEYQSQSTSGSLLPVQWEAEGTLEKVEK